MCLGAQSAAYKSLLPEAVILDGYVKKELYLQPAAWEFFGAFESYVGNKALEYDALERICKTFWSEGGHSLIRSGSVLFL